MASNDGTLSAEAVPVGRQGWCHWVSSSMAHLAEVERRIMQSLKSKLVSQFVFLPQSQNRLWTVSANPGNDRTPLVMIHGMAGGVGLWAQNIDSLCTTRPLHAFDLLGFGRSSRPKFSKKAELAENEFVESVEEWRKEMQLDEMVLLGHSLGAFIASSYALKYPERIKHLILVDPWGFEEKPDNESIPRWARVIITLVQPFNPLAIVRAAGPWDMSTNLDEAISVLRRVADQISSTSSSLTSSASGSSASRTPSSSVSEEHRRLFSRTMRLNPYRSRTGRTDNNLVRIDGRRKGLSLMQNGPLPCFLTEEELETLLSHNLTPVQEQFRDGLNRLGFVDLMRRKPCVKYLFRLSARSTLTQRKLIHILKPIFSDIGSNRRLKEDATYQKFLAYLKEVSGGRRGTEKAKVTLEKILQFVTASAEIPVLGYYMPPKIEFFDDGSMLPRSSTCINVLYLPLGHLPDDIALFFFFDYAFLNEYFGKM